MDIEDIWLNLLLTLGVIIVLGCFIYEIHSEIKINESIIIQSEQYTTYNSCNKIQGKYYCKN